MRGTTSILLILVLAVIAGCAMDPSRSEQAASGQTIVEARWCESYVEGSYLCGLEWKDGKEKSNVTLHVELPNGYKLDYTASDVKAFDGQAIRAAVEAVMVDATAETIDNVTRGIIRGLILGPAAAGVIELGGAAIVR